MNRSVPEAPTRRPRQSARRGGREQGSGSKPLGHRPRSFRNPVFALERRAVRRMLSWFGNPPLTVVLYDAEEISASTSTPSGRVLIRDRLTLWKLILDPMYEFGEAYAAGKIEVEGDLAELFSIVFRSFEQGATNRSLSMRLLQLLHKPRGSTLSKSRDNIAHHYDIGNDFYRLWLDEQMVYTCAYFSRPSQTLEEAQVAKMRHVCRKLRLRPGQTVLEAGCGWGSLALHMASHYGVTVKAFNISHEQITYAREEARRNGLEHQVEFIEDDWRNMHQPCDAFVSVGMLEHVGVANHGQLGDVIHRCLKPRGFGLIHTIGQNYPRRLNPWIERHIFPGAQPPTLRQMMPILEAHDFSVLDVENLRLHYAVTLRHWLDRFEQAADSVREMFDERFVRMWRFYLAGSIATFETGGLQLFQVLFARSLNNDVPWTREDLYAARRNEVATLTAP